MIAALVSVMTGIGSMLHEFAVASAGAKPKDPFACPIASWGDDDPERYQWGDDEFDDWPGIVNGMDGARVIGWHFRCSTAPTAFASGFMDAFDGDAEAPYYDDHAGYMNGHALGLWCRGLAGHEVAT